MIQATSISTDFQEDLADINIHTRNSSTGNLSYHSSSVLLQLLPFRITLMALVILILAQVRPKQYIYILNMVMEMVFGIYR